MVSRLKIEYYKNLLHTMKVAKAKGKINLAKPIFMLSILQGIQYGTIIDNHITLSESLINTYKAFFNKYNQTSLTSHIYPYYYLKSEEFYHLVGDCDRKNPTSKYLREHVEYAYLDEELWELLQDEGARNEIKDAIVNFFIKPSTTR
ncbi:MAG: hypothetical protein IJS89_06950 [Bacteroidaceae bacterium]|nr:hypothetical protein [Bacteroidaceae bacterium]